MDLHGKRRAAAESLAGLADTLGAEVIAQDHVIAPVAEIVTHGELALRKKTKPRGSFMFLGPTGVGKTQLAKALARALGGDLVALDLSEFQTAESVDVFLGRGAGDDGRFGAAMARAKNPVVVLCDEFEKAYAKLLDLFLQVLDEGRLTVSSGRVFDLRQLYVILTTNLGAAAAARMRHNSDAAVERTVVQYARQNVRPEFFARVDHVAVFRRLGLHAQEKVCSYHIGRKIAELAVDGIEVTIDASAEQFILGDGFSEMDGARPLERAIDKHVNRAIVEQLRGRRDLRGRLRVNAAGNGLEFEPAAPGASAA